jgi:hypothetical protein
MIRILIISVIILVLYKVNTKIDTSYILIRTLLNSAIFALSIILIIIFILHLSENSI